MRAILTFHSIDASASALSYPPHAFACLLESLAQAGPPIMDLDELLRPGTPTGIAITFDDGMRSVFTAALPMLRHYNVPAHLFLATGGIEPAGRRDHAGNPGGAPDRLDWREVEQLHANGVCIESHTHDHPDLRALTTTQVVDQCERADRLIEQRLGRRPRYFAYPFGYHNEQVRASLAGRYAAALTTDLRPLEPDEDPASLPRLDAWYLRSEFSQRNLDTRLMRAYLSLRRTLRQLRGTQ